MTHPRRLLPLVSLLLVTACDFIQIPNPAQSAPPPANPPPRFASQPPSGNIITIYLPRLFPDGSLGLSATKRGIPPRDDQLMDALRALIQGPSGDERAEDYDAALDRHTKVTSIQRDGDAALVAFDDNLARVRGRPFSELAYWAIVFTATETPGVQRLGLLQQNTPLTAFGYPAVSISSRAGRSDAPAWVRPR